MDTGSVLLILFVAIAAVGALMATMIHIVKPGEIGLVYRRGAFLRLIKPGHIVMAMPIIFKVHRVKTESLRIVVKSSTYGAELRLGIADPSRVPVPVGEAGLETRNKASELVQKSLSRYGSDKDRLDTTAAEEIENRLDTILRDEGLKVESLKIERLSEKRP